MSSEELGQKYFTRDRVRNRMIKRAAELWGFSESEIDDFDPLVSLLIEACSVEFEKIAGEIGKTQNRMLERLAHLLYPGMISVRPACGIIQARSSEPVSVIYPDAQFVYRNTGNDRNDRSSGSDRKNNAAAELFFSPAMPCQIMDASVRYIASARELFQVENGLQRIPVASSRQINTAYQHTLWLGIDIPEGMGMPANTSFFFNWINQPGSETWYRYLSYTHWSLPGLNLQQTEGFSPLQGREIPAHPLSGEFDTMGKIEEEVVRLFHHHFITLTSYADPEQLRQSRCNYPEVFQTLFDGRDLRELTQSLVWIVINFPTAIPREALDNVNCGINCFPALNRKLNTLTYRLLQNLNIIPLETEGAFLSVREITNSQGDLVKLAPFANPAGLLPETYTLRYGVNRFDERNAYEVLVNLVELIREESSFFSSLGQDFLSQNIRELNQILARLEEKITPENSRQSPHPFLIIKPRKEGNNVMIAYWSCNGEAANKIARGLLLQPYKNSNVRSGTLYFMTATAGGRDHFSDSEKIDHYRKFLLTRNRIVTREDLRIFLKAELGTLAADIDIRNHYISGGSPGEGFMRCVEIRITPEKNALDPGEWEYRLRELRLRLEKQSASHLPYHILLNPPIDPQ